MYALGEMSVYVAVVLAYGGFWWLWRVGWPAWRRHEAPLATSFFQFISIAVLAAISLIMALTVLKVQWPIWLVLGVTLAGITLLFLILEGILYKLLPQGAGIPSKLPLFLIVLALMNFVVWMALPEAWVKVWTQGANTAVALEAVLIVWIAFVAGTEQWQGAPRSLLNTILVGTAGFLLWKILVEVFKYPSEATAWALLAGGLLIALLWSPAGGGPSTILFRIAASILSLVKTILFLTVLLGFIFFAVPLLVGQVPWPTDFSAASLEKFIQGAQEFWSSLVGGGKR